MTSTRDNPGAFNATALPGVRALTAKALWFARKRDYRGAALSALVDTANLVESRTARLLPRRYRCTCCGHEAHSFQHIFTDGRVRWNSACPACNSRSRHRGLALLLPSLLAERRPARVLHFAPEPVLRPLLDRPELTYETADLFLEDATHHGVDVQHLPFADGSYDLVVCNHVLEHVPDDSAAIAEIARVLTNGGAAVITVPGDFSRAETVVYEGELPNGHYRDYGFDVVDRLERVFGRVDVIDMHDLEDPAHPAAVRRGDVAFVCDRPRRT